MITEDPAVFLADFGVPCTSNGVPFTGVLDTPDQTLSMAGVNVLSTMYALTVKTADVTAAAIATGSAVTVNGAPFVVRDTVLQDDGVFSILTLSK